MTKLNREKAVKIIGLMDQLRAELVGTCISVEGATTAAEVEEVKQEQSKFKVGDKVEFVDVTKVIPRRNTKNGDKATVINANERGIIVRFNSGEKLPIFISELGCIQLITEQPKSPNQQRKEVIEKAKEFVYQTLQCEFYGNVPMLDGTYSNVRFGITDEIKFAVNEEKRTVVALIHNDFFVNHRSIVKCNPNDVFNEYIGKAIALGRVLGLDVREFENAVQPTEVVPGMNVVFLKDDCLKSKIISDTNARY